MVEKPYLLLVAERHEEAGFEMNITTSQQKHSSGGDLESYDVRIGDAFAKVTTPLMDRATGVMKALLLKEKQHYFSLKSLLRVKEFMHRSSEEEAKRALLSRAANEAIQSQ